MPKLVEALVQQLLLYYMLRWDVACWIWPIYLDRSVCTMAVHICALYVRNESYKVVVDESYKVVEVLPLHNFVSFIAL